MLEYHQQKLLCENVSEMEIKEELFSMDDSKSPGVDGYTAGFFKKTWNIVKDDFVIAVQEFFQKGALLKVFNCTIITLVPKCPQPQSVREFRPIACCTVFFKVLS